MTITTADNANSVKVEVATHTAIHARHVSMMYVLTIVLHVSIALREAASPTHVLITVIVVQDVYV
jgi:hypothetical protein